MELRVQFTSIVKHVLNIRKKEITLGLRYLRTSWRCLVRMLKAEQSEGREDVSMPGREIM